MQWNRILKGILLLLGVVSILFFVSQFKFSDITATSLRDRNKKVSVSGPYRNTAFCGGVYRAPHVHIGEVEVIARVAELAKNTNLVCHNVIANVQDNTVSAELYLLPDSSAEYLLRLPGAEFRIMTDTNAIYLVDPFDASLFYVGPLKSRPKKDLKTRP